MTETEIRSAMEMAVEQVRLKNPMAPSITNTVTQDFVANAQLAVGGSAAMLYLADECEAMAKAAPAFYINMGTAMPFYAETLPRTARALYENNTPWVLDPVGIGLSEVRMDCLRKFKNFKPSIIRGNASEIISLAKFWDLIEDTGGQVRGVDSTEKVSSAKPAALALAKFTGGAVAVSGEEDFVTDGKEEIACAGGSILFTKITGSGCALGGVMAVYLTVASPFIAALTATTMFNLAGTKAAEVGVPASFKVNFLDTLYELTAQEVSGNFRVIGSFENMFNGLFKE